MRRLLILMMVLVLSPILCGCSGSDASSSTLAQTRSLASTERATAQMTNGASTGAARASVVGSSGSSTAAARHGGASPALVATTQVAQKETRWEAAVQTVLNYYGDINQKKYEEAYTTWEGNGSASGQSFEQFKRGYGDTVAVSVLVGESNEQGAIPIKVPVRLISIVNEPAANEQGVRQYAGTYTVRHTADGWRIATADISRVSGALPPRELSTPTRLLGSYYQEINRRQFARAYTYWEDLGKASNQSFANFEQGYADTNHVVVSLGRPQVQGAAGSLFASVPVVIVATNNNQTKQSFCGTYVLRRSDIPPFDKLGWRIYSAKIVQTPSSVQPGSKQAENLLKGGCRT